MKVKVVTRILEANERIAAENRRIFDEAGVYVINLMSAPGAGKTSLLERTIKELNGKVSHAIDRYTDCLGDLLAEGVKSGEVREDIDLKAAATALFGIIQGMVNIWALNNYGFDPQEKFAPLWSILREAVIKR